MKSKIGVRHVMRAEQRQMFERQGLLYGFCSEAEKFVLTLIKIQMWKIQNDWDQKRMLWICLEQGWMEQS